MQKMITFKKGRTIWLWAIMILFFSTGAFAQTKPNIIWLMAEDISNDLACYGMKAVKTPNLDALAATGIKYTNCFVTNPICSPSRSAMMTGMHQLQINAQHHRSNRDVPLPINIKPFTYYLRQAGYTCILGNELVKGKGRKTDCNFKHQAIGPYDGVSKFGLFDQLDVLPTDGKPFFAQIQLVATHRGDWWDEVRQQSKHPLDPAKVELPPYLPNDSIVRLDWAKYLDQMEYIDNEVGLIIADLKKKNLYDNTVIIFIGDNGRCNVFGKGYLHEPGLLVPFIMNWPKGIPTPSVNNDVVMTTDITATILTLAGIKAPANMDGRSVMTKGSGRTFAYGARDTWDEILDKSRSVYTTQYAYINNQMPWVPWDAHQTYIEFYRPAVHRLRALKYEGKLDSITASFLQPIKPVEELYDRKNDPYQLHNLSANPVYASVLKKMRSIQLAESKRLQAPINIYHSTYAQSVDIYDFVKYRYPAQYAEMLAGKEIGFQKFSKLYEEWMIANGYTDPDTD